MPYTGRDKRQSRSIEALSFTTRTTRLHSTLWLPVLRIKRLKSRQALTGQALKILDKSTRNTKTLRSGMCLLFRAFLYSVSCHTETTSKGRARNELHDDIGTNEGESYKSM